MRHMVGQGSSIGFYFMRESNNQPHSHTNATTFTHYYFVFHTKKGLAGNSIFNFELCREEEDISTFKNAGKLVISVHTSLAIFF